MFGLCRSWRGVKTASVEGLCHQQGGLVVADDACDGSAHVGRCETDQGYGLQLTYLYFAPAYSPKSAQQGCENLASCSFSCKWSP